MPYQGRYYSEDTVYEIIPRAKAHLPLPPTQTSNEIRLGILGRTQRDNKVDLCHFVDMNSHSHNMAVSKTCANLNKFHMELKKKTTDAVKALLGKESLSLWERRTPVVEISTLYDAIERVIYIYSNPSNASLCDSIDEYPGISSWSAFKECEPSVDAEVEIDARWHRMAQIPRLPKNLALSPFQDATICHQLKNSKKAERHPIIVKPFKWLETYGVTDPARIEGIRQKIINRVRENERANTTARAESNKRAVPSDVLKKQPYMKPHVPKKRERQIFVICSDTDMRIKRIEEQKRVLAECKEGYKKLKAGVWVDWPKGTFMPWFPPNFVVPAKT